ncbi:MAG TPA: HNH endonuclease signature motif containing protein [Acidimicrobiales bacterium]|nr:HNH endonuclease signature motif containing protein [Acidimicrobiales bacterium]
MFVEELEAAVAGVRRLLGSTEFETVDGDEARRVAGCFAEVERLGAAGVALLAPKVVAAGSYAKDGHGTAADWLGSLTGTSPSAARRCLKAATAAVGSPAIKEALQGGRVSPAQLELLASVAGSEAAAPGALEHLLPLVGEASLRELADEAARLRAAARSKEDERARRARVHRFRHLSWHQDPGGGVRGEFLCDELDWAKVVPGIERRAARRQRDARRTGSAESMGAHRLDAFLEILGGNGAGTARPHTLLVVDAESLRRGETRRGETCAIDGIGPVSVEAATELMGEGSLQILVRDGVDIRTVTKTSRVIPQRVQAALVVRDRICVVPGCGAVVGLQADHCDVDYRLGGPTELDNLARLCVPHHDLKTHGGWKLKGGPGRWEWIAPARPLSAGYIARARRLAAIRGKAARAGP